MAFFVRPVRLLLMHFHYCHICLCIDPFVRLRIILSIAGLHPILTYQAQSQAIIKQARDEQMRYKEGAIS